MSLLLAALLGMVLFVILNILTDTAAQNPAAPAALQDLIHSPALETLNLIFAVLIPAAFLVGAAGATAVFVRRRRHTT